DRGVRTLLRRSRNARLGARHHGDVQLASFGPDHLLERDRIAPRQHAFDRDERDVVLPRHGGQREQRGNEQPSHSRECTEPAMAAEKRDALTSAYALTVRFTQPRRTTTARFVTATDICRLSTNVSPRMHDRAALARRLLSLCPRELQPFTGGPPHEETAERLHPDRADDRRRDH